MTRMLAGILTWALVAGQVMQPVYAVLTPLADVPIAAKVAAKPNIVYTLDDSGSMQLSYIPEFVVGNYCRNGSTAAACAAIPLYNSAFTHPPVMAADFNHLAYNPDVTYQPPLKADGTPMTYSIGTVTDASGNQINLTKVQRDPYLAPATLDPLGVLAVGDGSNVTVPLFCNSDWPLDTTIGTKGQYQAGKGADCRINGTRYDAFPNGAPAVSADYNYPWQPTVAPANAQYFWQRTNKTLWCDKTNTGWPQTCTANGTYSCSVGVPTGGTSSPQTCYFQSNQTGCTSTVWAPAGCNLTTGIYTGFGCTGTECLSCTSSCGATGTTGKNGRCHLTANGGPPGSGGSNAACNCSGASCTLPACSNFVVAPTGCTLGGVLTANKTCTANAGACGDFIFDPVTKTNTATTLLADSNGPGTICRHNNQNYGGAPSAGPVNYTNLPLDVKYKSPITSGCGTFPNTATIPRHYYTVSSIDFCPATIPAAGNAKWAGFGTGVCSPEKKNDQVTNKNVQYGTFRRADLINDGRTYPYVDIATGAALTRTYAQEAVNYANWYAYYRTRILAAKTTSGIAFSFLTSQGADPIAYRVGFHNFGVELPPNGTGAPITWVDVKEWDLAQRTAWYTSLYNVSVSTGKTPTISAMLRIGNLFEKGGSAGGDAAVNPLPLSAQDPIDRDTSGALISCQNNYHILFTDGYTNQIAPTSTAGERDQNLPAWPWPGIVETVPDQVVTNLHGGLWPKPFRQGAPAISNTLADVAAYYWVRDLRDGSFGAPLKNDVPSASGASNGDLDPTKDVAWWQHVNFSALSFGSDGVLNASNQKATLAAISAGTKSWPDLTTPWSPINPPGAGKGAVAVDDLWHATVMGRGSFVYAKSPVEVSYGLANILAGIQNQRTSRVGAAFGGQVLDANNNVVFESTIEPGWGGDLLKTEINPATGAFVKTWWNATVELAKQIEIDPSTPTAQPWMDETKRRVVTLANAPALGSIPGPGVPFQYTPLSGAPAGSAMLGSLASSTAQQQKIIAYLRGGSSFGPPYTGSPWVSIEGTSIGQFRQRPSAGQDAVTFAPAVVQLGAGLGDISNAQPVIVGPPERNYVDATDPGYGCAPAGPYCAVPSGYALAKVARPTVVVAPANDGMVHVFNAGPLKPVAAGGGTELFAYIPRALFRGTAGVAATEDATAIQALTYQDGGVPIYHHHMYVDSSPRAADVDFANGIGAPDWRTIVVGGLGKGGNSYYALDLTDVSVPDEATAAAKVLWEWTNPDTDVVPGQKLISGGSPGYTFGRPVIVKVRQAGYPTGRWVVIVTGGYNNFSGKGKVFFIDAVTGRTLSTVTTSAGSNGNASGLAQIHAFVKNQNNQTAEQIYGGDLMGNVWRIDVSDPAVASKSFLTAPAVLFAELKDPLGVAQPVTTAPQIEIDLNNGVDRYVFFGTGRLLHPDDLTSPAIPQPQTMYAIRDGTLATIETAGLPIQPRATLEPIDAGSGGVNAIVGGAPNGWYHDLPSDPANLLLGAQRIVVDPQSSVNIASYIGTKIQDDPCIISLPAFLYARDYTTAKSLLESAGGAIVPYVEFAQGLNDAQLVGRVQADGSLSLAALGSSPPKPGSPAITPVNIRNPVTGPGLRWSWRLLTGQ